MTSKSQLRALKKLRPILLSNTHALPSLIHNSLQASITSPPTDSSLTNLIQSITNTACSSLPPHASPLDQQKAILELAAKLPTPETRRVVHLSVLDEVCKSTSGEEAGGMGVGKVDRVVNLGRSMYVPAEVIAQKVREKFWYRM